MAGASDKARYFLERYVPELQEFSEKNIFSADEIANIVAKRSDFEHILNSRGSTPADCARYATYEMNLERLRKRRCKGLGIRSSQQSGRRNVFFILDRATTRFPGDVRLWIQYIEYCQKEKASKRLDKVFTQVLRLHPREYGLWILAAKHYAERDGDMSNARSYFQRGLRFCKDIANLWLEYAKLEMIYLAKISARRRILGLDEVHTVDQPEMGEDIVMLPTITAADINPDAAVVKDKINEKALHGFTSSPLLSGEIPKAIFDAAMTATQHDLNLIESFFDMVSSFEPIPGQQAITDHILQHLKAIAPSSVQAIICQSWNDLSVVSISSAEFAETLSLVLTRISSGLGNSERNDHGMLAEKSILMLLRISTRDADLEPEIVAVLEATINQYLRALESISPRKSACALFLKLMEGKKHKGVLKYSEILDIYNHP